MTIADLLRDYRAGTRTPVDVVAGIFDRIGAGDRAPVWISLADRDEALRRAATVDLSLPLAGIPFAVKDNIDVAGLPTTAACPSFAYVPERSATVVQRLVEAGAIVIGKTNLDQFATGLVGVRSPYGACSNTFDDRYISGGSSSGSAVAVATDLAAFSLGTDTAGSGRVPAAFNNLIGLKPSKGLLSTAGVVPACRSLDCVSVFATTVADADAVWRVAMGDDPADPFSRTIAPGTDAAPWAGDVGAPFRFGVPPASQLAFFDDPDTPTLFAAAVARLEAIGGTRVEIDFTPFQQAAALLYSGPWVAERTAAVGDFLAGDPPDVHPVVGAIIRGGSGVGAVDTFRATYRLQALVREAAAQWAAMDVLLLPTAGTIYTKAAVEADPVRLNSNLGFYTNFVNLMDLAALAIPAGFRPDGLPFGVTLIGPAFSDAGLLALGHRAMSGHASSAPVAGASPLTDTLPAYPGCITVAVVGAHLSGQPLNGQLVERGARLVRTCRTAPDYRFYALADTVPPKPGLVREPAFSGPGIEVELWAVPEGRFGTFVAAVPPPLGIGNVRLETGEWVKGFICEPSGLAGATEITAFGGWRAYRASIAR